MTGDFDGLTSGQWLARRQLLEQARDPSGPPSHGAMATLGERVLAASFFVLVGAPLAIRLRNADVWSSFGVCFLPILCVYYPLMMGGVERAKSGALPPYSVWLGNVILSVAGCWLLRKVIRY